MELFWPGAVVLLFGSPVVPYVFTVFLSAGLSQNCIFGRKKKLCLLLVWAEIGAFYSPEAVPLRCGLVWATFGLPFFLPQRSQPKLGFWKIKKNWQLSLSQNCVFGQKKTLAAFPGRVTDGKKFHCGRSVVWGTRCFYGLLGGGFGAL
jgi:hypothetical protein